MHAIGISFEDVVALALVELLMIGLAAYVMYVAHSDRQWSWRQRFDRFLPDVLDDAAPTPPAMPMYVNAFTSAVVDLHEPAPSPRQPTALGWPETSPA